MKNDAIPGGRRSRRKNEGESKSNLQSAHPVADGMVYSIGHPDGPCEGKQRISLASDILTDKRRRKIGIRRRQQGLPMLPNTSFLSDCIEFAGARCCPADGIQPAIRPAGVIVYPEHPEYQELFEGGMVTVFCHY